jgi:hypothetical protein
MVVTAIRKDEAQIGAIKETTKSGEKEGGENLSTG